MPGLVVYEPVGSPEHPAHAPIVETWIAAQGQHFIGTQESRFTMSIQLERGFLGFGADASEEFCP